MTEAHEAAAQPRSWPLTPLDVAGSLLALSTLAVMQPLLDLIGRNGAFLVAHGVRRAEVVALPLALAIGLPLLAAAVVLLLRLASRPLASAVHAVLLWVLGAALALVIARLSGMVATLPGFALLVAAFVVGAAVPLGYSRSGQFRRVVTVAAFTAPAVVVLFLFASEAGALARGQSAPAHSVVVPADAPPVVIVLLDEFPVASLLTDEGEVDAEAFPAFAGFVEDAVFYRNTTTPALFTADAAPAALSGHYPELSDLPVAADHPDNLLALLSDYDMHVDEPLTQLCPPGRCQRTISAWERYSTTARDTAVVAAHLVLPPDLAEGLPPINQGWRDFGADAGADKKAALDARFWETRATDPAVVFRRFIDGVEASQGPKLHYLHSLLPHHPFRYLPDGRPYSDSDEVPGLVGPTWVGDPWAVIHSYQRHLLQVQLADQLLGELFAKLEQEGMYDEAVIAVFSDHGASFTHGASMRGMRQDTVGEIMPVPLFIKPSGRGGGDVSDEPAEIVDLAPTVLEAVGAQIPDGLDGQSLLGPPVRRTEKRLQASSGALMYPADGQQKWPFVERKNDWFGQDGPFDFPFNLAPPGQSHLLGNPVPDESPAEIPQLTVELPDANAWDDVQLAGPALPVLVDGRISGQLHGDRPALAVGVNGTIAAVTLVEEPDQQLRAMLPSDLLREGRNEVTFWLVQSYGLVELAVEGRETPSGG